MKYEITKEQILKLANKAEQGCTSVIESDLKNWFPEAFKKELEIGKWYITDGNKCGQYGKTLIANFSGKEESSNYGITFFGTWGKDLTLYHNDLGRSTRLATPEEVEVALINEAKKRGFVEGAKFKSTISEKGQIRTVTEKRNWDFYLSYNSLNTSTPQTEWYNFNTQLQSNPTIFRDGKWAEILYQEKTVVPIAKALKIIAKKMKVSPENIEIQY